MAQTQRVLRATKVAYVDRERPNTHIPLNSSSGYLISGSSYTKKQMLFGFQHMPDSLRHREFYGAKVVLRVKPGVAAQYYHRLFSSALDGDFNADTVTANTTPDPIGWYNIPLDTSNSLTSSWQDVTFPLSSSIAVDRLADICKYYAYGVYSPDGYNDYSENWYINNTLSDGTAPYLIVYYDDTANIKSKVYSVAKSGELSPSVAQTFSWYYRQDYNTTPGYCADPTWTQASAKLYWKAGSGSWNTINISGSALSYTVPAGTFPSGATITWYVQGTDTDGTTTSSDQTSFTTKTLKVTPTTYPSGNSIDNRVAQRFAWTLADTDGTASATQTSAKLYWRVSGAGSYQQISISGNTKSKDVPGYTFPANSTIEWYISATAQNGSTASSSVLSFKTQAFSISVTSAPSGSNIDTRSAISFSWKITNSSGDAAQSSAKFYWRVSGAATYTQVNISGGTKSVSIPANTFPTGKTIQWYVSATAEDGTVLTTSAATFSTVTTKITLDTYPSGSNVYTAAGLRFTWHFASAVGNYAQSSAKLYWRASTSSNYSQINVPGSTQELTVPANTFPTGKTIQWYIEGTDIGGSTSTTSVMSFNTVTTQITPQSSPTSGYADPRYAITFQWYFASTGGPVPQGSATFYWREAGEENWTAVAASGSTAKVTIAANTFPVASEVEWYLDGTDVGGTSSTSAVFTFSTAAETAYAYPQSPIGITIDSSKPITLSWTLVNADGTLPIRVTLQWKKPTDINWTTIRQADEAFTEWEVSAGYFPVGEIEWRVIATNRDDVDGPAGTAAFVSVRAPDAPVGVSATPVPRTTISWQGENQEGYEIIIDNITVKQAYGTENSWTPDFVLDDGTHVISVRIQGQYGLWSEPGITTVSILNIVPEGWEDLEITGAFDVDAVLHASGAVSAVNPAINWFRDGKRIAITQNLRDYSDRYVLGKHSYYVEIWNGDGNYARSNSIEGSMRSCITRIAPFAGGDWIDLRLSKNSNDEQAFTYNRVSTMRHVLGAVYPVLEMSSFEDLSGSYDCAFTNVEDAAELENLRGRQVIIKSRGGNVIIGALLNLQKRYGEFFISYTFTISAIDWEDFRYVSQND